jgi:hypothetical protein
MMQINVTVNYKGKNYLTNVLANRNTPDEEILRLAFEQVKKQWSTRGKERLF